MAEYICITGVSSGLGKDLAGYLMERGFHVIGTVRQVADAVYLEEKYPDLFHFSVVDVTKKEDIKSFANKVAMICGPNGIKALINNAGIAVSGPLMYLEDGELENQLNVNVIGLHRVTKSLFPLLNAHPDARIVNMSSVSGLISYIFLGPYACSKHAVESYSDVLRRELSGFGIKVIVIEPTAAKSKIWDKNLSQIRKYLDTPYGDALKKGERIIARSSESGMEAEEVSKVIYESITRDKPAHRVIVGRKKWLTKLIAYWLPERMVDRLMIKKMIGDRKIQAD